LADGLLQRGERRGAGDGRVADREPAEIGLVGLGTGTLAAYGQAGDYLRFYEINPDVLRLASNQSRASLNAETQRNAEERREK
jgi:hypothetical protein